MSTNPSRRSPSGLPPSSPPRGSTPQPSSGQSHSEKRPNEDGDSDDEERPPRKLSRAEPDPIQYKGRALARMHHAFCDIQTIIEDGRVLERVPEEDCFEWTERTHRTLRRWIHLQDVYPKVVQDVRSHGEEGAITIARLLTAGRKSARGEDVKMFKTNISHWGYNFVPSLTGKSPVCGFNHQQCLKLLIPPNWKTSDPSIVAKIQGHVQPFIVTPKDLPAFLWRREICNELDIFTGIFEHELLFSGGLAIYRGQQSGKDGVPGRGKGKTIAARHGIKYITPAFICYVATLLRYTLSLDTQFTADSGGFSLGKFYKNLLCLIEETMTEEHCEQLLQKWQSRIFGDCDDCESGPEEIADAENERPPSMLTLLLDQQKKEIEQRKRDEEYEEARRRADQAARALQQLANNS